MMLKNDDIKKPVNECSFCDKWSGDIWEVNFEDEKDDVFTIDVFSFSFSFSFSSQSLKIYSISSYILYLKK